MSFRSSGVKSGRAFECVRRSLLLADELPFSNVLTADRLADVFESEGVDCSGDDAPDVIYTPAVTLWAFLSQMLFTGEQRSCTAAVARVAVVETLSGRVVSDTNTGAYCRARGRIPETVPQRLTYDLARECERQLPEEWRWKGQRTFLVDGSTVSMPDTPENQAEYPQSSSQAEGLGFPVMRVVALLSLATAMIHGLALGPCSGKETGETALFRQLFELLKRGDVVVADRYYAGWFTIALLQELGVEVVTRLHQHRTADFRRGHRLGADDHLVDWPKPQRPDWLDQETYDRLPNTLTVREMKFAVRERGFRTQSIVVVTTLRDETTITREDLADLFRQRWHAELDLRSIKSTMSLDVLRCKTPAMVRTELWTGLLAYNLVRHSLLPAADAAKCSPRQLSFCAAQQFLANTWLLAAVNRDETSRLIELRLIHLASHRIGNRPDRIEPRAIKRRPTPHDWLTKPRAACHAHARRKFFDAKENHPLLASQFLALYQQLYDVEDRARDLSPAERQTLRESDARPIWTRLCELLKGDVAKRVLPKDKIADALNYVRNHREAQYLTDGRLPIDNNDVEQLMKQVAIGRKNWLFIGSVLSGERAANFLTLVSSALRNDLDVYAYLKAVLDALLSGSTDYAALRPDTWATAHPESIRAYRQAERRDRYARKSARRADRRATAKSDNS